MIYGMERKEYCPSGLGCQAAPDAARPGRLTGGGCTSKGKGVKGMGILIIHHPKGERQAKADANSKPKIKSSKNDGVYHMEISEKSTYIHKGTPESEMRVNDWWCRERS